MLPAHNLSPYPGTGPKLDQTLALLVADDPRISAGRLLDHIAARCKVKRAAAVTVDSGELASFVGEVPLSRLTALQSLWRAEAKELRAGRAVIGDDSSVLPLMDGRELIGLLFVESPASVGTGNPAVVALAAALRAARERSARELPEEAIADGEIERFRLVAALERHEWNIARVARLIGVTRRTVYLRLKRYKIDRRRVPKTLKACPPLGGA
jgi:Bacterial regulatory protein, Fis family